MLDFDKDLLGAIIDFLVPDQTEKHVQLVYGAVAFNPDMVLVDPSSCKKGGGCLVTGFGINFHLWLQFVSLQSK